MFLVGIGLGLIWALIVTLITFIKLRSENDELQNRSK